MSSQSSTPPTRRSSPSTRRFRQTLALQGFDGVRAFAADPDASRGLLEEALAFDASGENTWEARGPSRGGFYSYDDPPSEPGVGGAGTVHHVAWASTMEDHDGVAGARALGGHQPDAGDRSLLVPLDLLPGAERRSLRDRHPRPGLREWTRIWSIWARASSSARVRAHARADRTGPDPPPGAARASASPRPRCRGSG